MEKFLGPQTIIVFTQSIIGWEHIHSNGFTVLPELDLEGQRAGDPGGLFPWDHGDAVGQAPAVLGQSLLDEVDDKFAVVCLVLEAGEAAQEQDQVHIRAVVQRCPLPRGATLGRKLMLKLCLSWSLKL